MFIFILIILLSSCGNKENRIWHDTKNGAIQQGLELSDAVEIQRLTVDNETLVLYKLNSSGAVAVGSVTHSDKGYAWYENMLPYIGGMVHVDYQTESKQVIPLTIGKVSDEKITEIVLEGYSNIYKLKVVKGYYFGVNIERNVREIQQN